MKILPDGTVEITNKRTKETKIVSPEDLPKYGIPYSKYSTELEAFKSIGGETTARIQKTEDEKVDAAMRVIEELENTYFREGQVLGLAYGEHGLGGRLKGVGKDLERKYAPTEESEQLNTYKRILESSRAQLAKAAGDTGNIALMEQILAGKALPDEQSTPQEAYALFQSVRRKFGVDESEKVGQLEKQFNKLKESANAEQYEAVLKSERQANQEPKLEGLLGLLAKGGTGAAKFLIPQTLKAVGAPFDPSHPLNKVESPEELAEAKGDILKSLELAGRSTGEFLKTVAPAGAELVMLKGLLGLKPKAVSGVRRLIKPISTAKAARIAETQAFQKAGGQIGSKSLRSTAQGMIDAKVATVKELPILKKLAAGNIKPKEALQMLVKSGQKSFTKSGDPRLTKAADYYSLLRDGLREEFAKKAPGVIEQTTRIARALPKKTTMQEPISRAFSKIFSPVTLGAGAAGAAASGAGFALLNKLGLFQRD